jgi:hypothetical protein
MNWATNILTRTQGGQNGTQLKQPEHVGLTSAGPPARGALTLLV